MITEPQILTCRDAARPAARPINVAYCVHREGLSSVFHSQVVVPVLQHDDDVDLRLVVHTPIGHLWRHNLRQRLDATTERCRSANLPIDWIASPPTRARWLLSDAKQLIRWVRRNYGDGDVILHCRNMRMAEIALNARPKLPNARIIYDSRGVEAFELRQELEQSAGSAGLSSQMRREIADAERMEARCAKESDHVMAVSSTMRDYLVERYRISVDKLTVVPCCLNPAPFDAVQASRESVREELGIADRFVVAYCGSLAWYQLPDQGLRITQLLRQHDPGTHFLGITTQPDIMKQELARAGIPRDDWTVLSVPPPEVPRLLAAADVGLLLRDDTLVNRVASPVKFAEYMAAGLPVVITDHLGDYSDSVREHQLGEVVSLPQSNKSIQAQLIALHERLMASPCQARSRCREFAADALSWSRHIPRIANLYKQIIQ